MRRKTIVKELLKGKDVGGLHPESRLRIEAHLLIEYARQTLSSSSTMARACDISLERPLARSDLPAGPEVERQSESSAVTASPSLTVPASSDADGEPEEEP